MELLVSDAVRKIDSLSPALFGVSLRELMRRAGLAVRDAVMREAAYGRVTVLCGKGNNGGDGYAMACELGSGFTVTAIDVFSEGQRTDEGKYFLEKYKLSGGKIIQACLISKEGLEEILLESDVIVDAIFGTGFSGELSHGLSELCSTVNRSPARIVSVDIPLGVCSDSAEVSSNAIKAHRTVALTGFKPCHLCYPAREYAGEVELSDLGIGELIPQELSDCGIYALNSSEISSLLPKRCASGHKGSFGRLAHITGSDKYRGAAHLSIEASLRSGVGMVCHFGSPQLNSELRLKFPEALYEDIDLKETDTAELADRLAAFDAVLIGSGSTVSYELYSLIIELSRREGCPLVLDADAINSISKYGPNAVFKGKKRNVILTPHPLELSRLTGIPVKKIESSRLGTAKKISDSLGATVILKGAGSIICDGERIYVNTTGSTALAKGGSGDVLAGLVTSLAAGMPDTLLAAAVGAYIHGLAADTLAERLSEFGVIPSDLPLQIAKTIKKLQQK